MSNHTPGPWKLVETESTDFTAIENLDGNEVLGTSEWLRANPVDLQLMAAAPDLLYALEEILLNETKLYNDMATVIEAKAAVAKAKGETE